MKSLAFSLQNVPTRFNRGVLCESFKFTTFYLFFLSNLSFIFADSSEILSDYNLDVIVISETGDLLRDSSHQVITELNQLEAQAICELKGMRLPTARELVIRATDYGIEFLDFKDVKTKEQIKKYTVVNVINPDGKEDKFYYRNTKDDKALYKAPSNEFGRLWFWSSSYHLDNSELAYMFYGKYGSLYYYDAETKANISTAYCVKDSN